MIKYKARSSINSTVGGNISQCQTRRAVYTSVAVARHIKPSRLC